MFVGHLILLWSGHEFQVQTLYSFLILLCPLLIFPNLRRNDLAFRPAVIEIEGNLDPDFFISGCTLRLPSVSFTDFSDFLCHCRKIVEFVHFWKWINVGHT